jgi:hypothetical protein
LEEASEQGFGTKGAVVQMVMMIIIINIKIVYLFHVKYVLFLSDFNYSNFLNIFPKNVQISNFMKFRPMEPSFSVRTEGRTDMTKLTVAIHNYTKAPIIVFSLIACILRTKADTALTSGQELNKRTRH